MTTTRITSSDQALSESRSGDAATLIALWTQIKRMSSDAAEAELIDVETLLRTAGDLVLQKYAAQGHPHKREIHSLIWEDQPFPMQTALFLELKSMLLEAEQRETDAEKSSAAQENGSSPVHELLKTVQHNLAPTSAG